MTDETTNVDGAGAAPDWLVTGPRSRKQIVVAPGARDGADTGRAVALVDDALRGFPGRVPAWFRLLERVGYWWWAVCLVAGLAIGLAFNPNEMKWKIASGLTLGLGGAPITGALLWTVAWLQARVFGPGGTAAVLASVVDAARPSNGDVLKHVTVVLARRPQLETRLHDLAWRAAANDGRARRELEDMWAEEEPEAAAALAAQFAELKASLAADRARAGADRAKKKG
jgi:hypothetical protein